MCHIVLVKEQTPFRSAVTLFALQPFTDQIKAHLLTERTRIKSMTFSRFAKFSSATCVKAHMRSKEA